MIVVLGVVDVSAGTGVVTTVAGGDTTTGCRSQPARPNEAKSVASSNEYFMAFPLR
jgi:hypothetical protein